MLGAIGRRVNDQAGMEVRSATSATRDNPPPRQVEPAVKYSDARGATQPLTYPMTKNASFFAHSLQWSSGVSQSGVI